MEISDAAMFTFLVRIFDLLRLVGIVVAVAGTLGRMWEGSMIELLPASLRPVALDVWQMIISWPVYAISLLLAGAWLQDWVDARMRASEGSPSWFGIVALRGRLLFTHWILGRPKLYSDALKLRRELDRANIALTRAGFAPLTGLPREADEDIGSAREYLKSVRALIPAIGPDRAARASHALKEHLLVTPAASDSEAHGASSV